MTEVLRTVESVMSGVMLYQNINANFLEVLDLLHRNNADAIIVMNNGLPQGIITEIEILQGLLTAREKFPQLTAKDFMRSPLVTVGHNDDIQQAKDMMINVNLSKLPVKKEDELVGLITQRDILNYLF
ncbi:CBS domain-containing protein [Candidatus Woesearchaeota archaeon]|nr:CBS domain-containing protein [Candidatus Woesearchaeota archaeon]